MLRLRLAISAIAAALFAVPAISMIVLGGDYVGVANESLAYRYFTSARLLDGERTGIWLPQGFTISTIQHAVVAVLDRIYDATALRPRFHAFGIATNLFVVSVNCLALLWAARSRAVSLADAIIIAIVCVTPIFCLTTAGFYYSIAPDYYHLNLTFITIAVCVFAVLRQRQSGLALRGGAVMVGVFVGLLLANKHSMLPIGVAAISPILFSQPLSTRWSKCWQLTVIGATATATIALVLAAFYLFDIHTLLAGLAKILEFSKNPGTEPNFWSGIRARFSSYNYSYVIAGFIFVSVATLIYLLLLIKFRRQPVSAGAHQSNGDAHHIPQRGSLPMERELLGRLTQAIFISGMGILQLYTVVHRPAGTTLFEASCVLIGLTGMLLIEIRERRVRAIAATLAVVSVGMLTIRTFSLQANLDQVRNSARQGELGWQLLDRMQSFGRPMIVVIPDDGHRWHSPEMVLLKGLSDFPSWEIKGGKRFFKVVHVPISFRTEQGGIRPSAPYPSDATVVWYDRTDLRSLCDQYPALAEAAAQRTCESYLIPHQSIRTTVCIPK